MPEVGAEADAAHASWQRYDEQVVRHTSPDNLLIIQEDGKTKRVLPEAGTSGMTHPMW